MPGQYQSLFPKANSVNSISYINLQKENAQIKKDLEQLKTRITELTPDTKDIPKFDYQPITVQAPSPLAVSSQTPFSKQIDAIESRISSPPSNNNVLKVKSMAGFSDAPGAELKPNQFGYANDYQEARKQGYSDADIRSFLEKDYKGNIGNAMKKLLDDPYWGRLTDNPGSDVKPNQFGYENDYKFAKQQGFSDSQIRQYLSSYSGNIGSKMKVLLDDPNWGQEATTSESTQASDPVSAFGEGFRAAQNVRLSENAQGFRARKSNASRFKGSGFGTSVFKINPTQGTSSASSGLNIGF